MKEQKHTDLTTWLFVNLLRVDLDIICFDNDGGAISKSFIQYKS